MIPTSEGGGNSKELAIVGSSSRFRSILKTAAKLAGSTVLGEAGWRYTTLQLISGHSPENALEELGACSAVIWIWSPKSARQ